MGLSDRFIRATFVPGWKTVADPKLLGKTVWRFAEGIGVRFVQATVSGVEADDANVAVHLQDGSVYRASKLVIAAGAWSHQLARTFGDRIPLETERGYNTTLPVGAFDVKRMLIFPSHGFVITPLSTGLRIGGAVEFAGLRRPPNFARSEAMLRKAQAFLPGLDNRGGKQWMGYRPSLPDSVPVIGHAKGRSNVFYAFGHGHLGLTQSAATGQLIRDLILDQAPPGLDLSPFSPQRFRTYRCRHHRSNSTGRCSNGPFAAVLPQQCYTLSISPMILHLASSQPDYEAGAVRMVWCGFCSTSSRLCPRRTSILRFRIIVGYVETCHKACRKSVG